jgi:hypothetical protein
MRGMKRGRVEDTHERRALNPFENSDRRKE